MKKNIVLILTILFLVDQLEFTILHAASLGTSTTWSNATLC